MDYYSKLLHNVLVFIINLGNIANIASIIGFIFTIFIFIRVNRIHSEYLFKIRGPFIIDKLNSHLSNILIYLNDIERFTFDIKKDFSFCHANLKSLENKVPRFLRNSCKKLRKKIKRSIITATIINKSEASNVCNEMQMIIEECINLRDDLFWRSNNE